MTPEQIKAAQEALSNRDKSIKCQRCDGKGFHHGFGETGHDPDYCNVCGGDGQITFDAYEFVEKYYETITHALAAMGRVAEIDLVALQASMEPAAHYNCAKCGEDYDFQTPVFDAAKLMLEICRGS